MRKHEIWTQEQIDYAMKQDKAGKTRNTIAREMERIFGVKRTGQNINVKLWNVKNTPVKTNAKWKTYKWTKAQINYALKQREKGVSFRELSSLMKKKFKVSRTSTTIRAKLYHLKKPEDNKKENKKENKEGKNMYENNYEPATRKQCRLYASLVLGGDASVDALKTFTEELYKDKALKGQFSKNDCSNQIKIALAANVVDEPKNGSPKTFSEKVEEHTVAYRYSRWTAEEEKQLFDNYNSPSDYLLIAVMLNRSVKAIERRRHEMKKSGRWVELQKQTYQNILAKEIKTELPQKIETFVEKHGNPTTRHLSNDEKEMFEEVKEVLEEAVVERKHERSRKAWKYDEEFDLLCNFYELSIDEAREKFERSYASLAQRLEMIVDSEEPEYILMLKKATKVISKRKKEEAKNAKMGFFMRRKIARKARKARKVARKAERLETKLNKLRGE